MSQPTDNTIAVRIAETVEQQGRISWEEIMTIVNSEKLMPAGADWMYIRGVMQLVTSMGIMKRTDDLSVETYTYCPA
jgi:hypothetical protein